MAKEATKKKEEAPKAVAVAVARAAAVPAVADDTRLATYGGLMDETPVDARDFLIPKLLLQQSQSKLVQAEKARTGEIRGSIDHNKVTEKGGAVEIIPFAVYKTWVTMTKVGSEYIGQEPVTPANVMKPREEKLPDGREVMNFETLNYYCLLPQEIAAGIFIPYVVSFRSTGYMAGKTLETHRARLQEFKKPLCFKTFHLGAMEKENDKGKFYVFTVAEARDTTDAELDAVKHWHGIVKQGRSKVDESDLTEDAKPARAAASVGVEVGAEY